MFLVQSVGPAPIQYTPGSVHGRRVERIGGAGASSGVELDPEQRSGTPQRHRFSAYERRPEDASPRQRRLIYARDLMSATVVTLPPEVSTNEARALFSRTTVHHIPVVDTARRVVGILSDRDLLLALLESTGGPRTVAEVMTTPVLTATPDTEIREVARVMFAEHVGCLPLTDERGILVGIMTRTDILRALLVDAPLELWG